MNILINNNFTKSQNYEIVERKGLGHPDTLSDALAEELSREYSKYTLKNFGYILHHNFDKVGLLGGKSKVSFGSGELIKPIRVILNGRASTKFGDKNIPVEKILTKVTQDFLLNFFPTLRPKDLEIFNFISTASSPGHTDEKSKIKGTRNFWFEPRGPQDLSETKFLHANDTSLGCGYAPYSDLDQIVLLIERELTTKVMKNKYPWIGTDIKIMGAADYTKNEIEITLCVPQIANYVKDLNAYRDNIEFLREFIDKKINDFKKKYKVKINVNMRDDYQTNELYLTAIGSSIESGDEGLVGRGNRINGLITPSRPMSMEGACGKNPVYHVGKIYNIAAKEVAEKISKEFDTYCEVYLVSQTGRSLIDPWRVNVNIGKKVDEKKLESIIAKNMKNMTKITDKLIQRKINLY